MNIVETKKANKPEEKPVDVSILENENGLRFSLPKVT